MRGGGTGPLKPQQPVVRDMVLNPASNLLLEDRGEKSLLLKKTFSILSAYCIKRITREIEAEQFKEVLTWGYLKI